MTGRLVDTSPFGRCLGLLLCVLVAIPLPGASGAELVLEDDAGRELHLRSPARRVISLAPHVTESLFAIGAGESLVGTVAWSDYPEAASKLPVIGSAQFVNYEGILALRPDLVITWHTGMGQAVIDRLQAMGLPVYVTEPRALPDIARALRHFGLMVGREAVGDAAATDFLQRLDALAARYSERPPVRVFYQVWHQPVITLNGRHLVSDVIRLCGGINIFATAVPLVPQVSVESVVSADPQVIIASAPDGRRPAWLDLWNHWPDIAAVRNQRLHSIAADLLERQGPRILEGARQLCEFLEAARASAGDRAVLADGTYVAPSR